MAFLYILLMTTLWVAVGWFVMLGLALVDTGVRWQMRDDNFVVLTYVAFWPLVLVSVAVFRLAQFMDPAGRAYEIIDRMDQRRDAKRNRGSVIVKSRRFRGKKD